MNRILKIYNSLKGFPLGKRLFSYITCKNAPYFGSIRPLFQELEPGRCIILMKKRKSVTNHIKTVHAIAMCNLVELAGGVCTDVSLPDGVRWIPKGMTVEYLALAKTDLKGVCLIDLEKIKNWDFSKDFPADVNVFDTSDKIVMRGTINMHLSRKKA
jgi:acyl-coenzyme A thioesterase PaaI-like protein